MKNAFGQEVRDTEQSLTVIADALIDPDGPGNITEAVYLCAGNLADIAKTLANIEKALMKISLNVLRDD
jgi:hypothetical protein